MTIEHAAMPVTPLARGMWRYRWILADDVVAAESYAAPRLVKPEQQASAKGMPISVGKTTLLENTNHKSLLASVPPAANLDWDRTVGASIAQYKSKDPQTGRIWGVPSAFGRGQCLDCPNKADPPSTRCVSCQVKLVQASCQPMPPDILQQVQDAFDALLKGDSG